MNGEFNFLGQRFQLKSTRYWEPLFADDTSDFDDIRNAVTENFILLLCIKSEIDDFEL